MEFKEFFYLMEKKGYAKFGFPSGPKTVDINQGAYGSNVAATRTPSLNTGPIGVTIPNASVFGAVTAPGNSEHPDLPLRSGGFWSTDWNNMDFDLKLPSTEKSGKITFLDKKRNPIVIAFTDNKHHTTRIYIPFDAYKRLQPEPELGRSMTVSMQRRMDDPSKAPSQIQSIKVF